MEPTLLFFAILIGLGVLLPIIGGALYLYEKKLAKKKVKAKKNITEPPNKPTNWPVPIETPGMVENILADMENKPHEWTVRWDRTTSKVMSVTKSMQAAQDGRENEISVTTDGSLSYQRCLDNYRATHDLNLGKSDKARLKKAFDTLIAKKMKGALDQVVI